MKLYAPFKEILMCMIVLFRLIQIYNIYHDILKCIHFMSIEQPQCVGFLLNCVLYLNFGILIGRGRAETNRISENGEEKKNFCKR